MHISIAVMTSAQDLPHKIQREVKISQHQCGSVLFLSSRSDHSNLGLV